jgi:clan AA aspartic protease (TIGR02281 family)
VQEDRKKKFEEYRCWREAHGEEQFFQEVNRLYAALHEVLPEAGANAGAVKAYLNQLRLVRKELATYARRREQEAENGVLIVPTLLAPDEECHMVVDTGATTVSLSPELVRVLGLTDRLGEEVEVSLAGGLRARGRELTLASVTVQGMEAREVEAVQLPESQCGVDGLLGLSYLNHFNYMVERERPQRLRLSLKGEALDAYDVFISYKSEDAWWARVVFDALTVMRYRPFLSDVSLREAHDVDFGKAIEAAVSSARHLVVVGTSAENIASPWVEKEWRLFIHLKLTHRKPGNIVAVPCGNMSARDLPPALSYYQAVPIFERDFRERLRDFLPLV